MSRFRSDFVPVPIGQRLHRRRRVEPREGGPWLHWRCLQHEPRCQLGNGAVWGPCPPRHESASLAHFAAPVRFGAGVPSASRCRPPPCRAGSARARGKGPIPLSKAAAGRHLHPDEGTAAAGAGAHGGGGAVHERIGRPGRCNPRPRPATAVERRRQGAVKRDQGGLEPSARSDTPHFSRGFRKGGGGPYPSMWPIRHSVARRAPAIHPGWRCVRVKPQPSTGDSPTCGNRFVLPSWQPCRRGRPALRVDSGGAIAICSLNSERLPSFRAGRVRDGQHDARRASVPATARLHSLSRHFGRRPLLRPMRF